MKKQQVKYNPSFRTFYLAQSVYFLAWNPCIDKWVPGTITARLGDLHYEIDFDGRTYKQHIDQVRSREARANLKSSSRLVQPEKVPEEPYRAPNKIRYYEASLEQPVAPQESILPGRPGNWILETQCTFAQLHRHQEKPHPRNISRLLYAGHRV